MSKGQKGILGAPMNDDAWETFLDTFQLKTTPGQDFCADVPGRNFDSTLKSYLLALKTSIGNTDQWKLALDNQYAQYSERYPLRYTGVYVQALAWSGVSAEQIFSQLQASGDSERQLSIFGLESIHSTEAFGVEREIIESLERVGMIYKICGNEVNYLSIVTMVEELGSKLAIQDYGYYWPGEQLQLGVLALELAEGNEEGIIEQWNKVLANGAFSKHFIQSLGNLMVNQVSWLTLEKNGLDLLNICIESQLFCSEYLKTAERYEENEDSVKAKRTMEEALTLVQDRMYTEEESYGMDSWVGIIYSHPLAEKYLSIGYEELEVLETEVINRIEQGSPFGFISLMEAYANREWTAEIHRFYTTLETKIYAESLRLTNTVEGQILAASLRMLKSTYCKAMMRAGDQDSVGKMLNSTMPDGWRLDLILSMGYEASEHKKTLEYSISILKDLADLEIRMSKDLERISTSELGTGDSLILERSSTNELARRILTQCLKLRRVDLIREVLKVNGCSDELKVSIVWEAYLYLRKNIATTGFVL